MKFKMMDWNMERSETTSGLFILNQAFRLGVPFNIPHGFSLKVVKRDRVELKLPKSKMNLNHLGTVHACAMATAGELSTGILLIKNFKATKVRLVLTNLNVEYKRQGTKDLLVTAKISEQELSKVSETLKTEGKAEVSIIAELTDPGGQVVSRATSTWQIKNWSAVTTKF